MKNKEISDPNEIVNEIKRIFKKVICKGFAKSLPQVDNFWWWLVEKQLAFWHHKIGKFVKLFNIKHEKA